MKASSNPRRDWFNFCCECSSFFLGFIALSCLVKKIAQGLSPIFEFTLKTKLVYVHMVDIDPQEKNYVHQNENDKLRSLSFCLQRSIRIIISTNRKLNSQKETFGAFLNYQIKRVKETTVSH